MPQEMARELIDRGPGYEFRSALAVLLGGARNVR